MAVEYEISSDVATITGVASNTQVASIVKFYTGSITYDDEPTSKYASVTINGKTQRVMLCIAVSGTVTYDDVPSKYSTVSGHRCLNIVEPTGTEIIDDAPSLYETITVDGKNVRAIRCVLVNQTPVYDGVSSTCTFVDSGKTHTAQLVNIVSGGAIETIVSGVAPLSLPDAVAGSLVSLKAFGGTEQRNIPQPYTQVNYVTNTAQTAVDTGIMIDFAKNYEFEVECRAVSGSWYILQSRASASGNVTGIHGETSGSTIKLVVGNVTVCTSAITRTVGNKLYVKATLNAGTATLYVKDETANTEDTQTGSYGTSQPNPTASVYLLGNAGGQYVDVNSDIYMARIKENDTVVMDYVPARQVATAGFYDTVSGTFKTALTPANLSADGNTVPTPDYPMDIVSNNGVLKARHESGLPLGYTLLDYIQSSGSQYIDTLRVPNNDDIIEQKFQKVGNSDATCSWYGSMPSSQTITPRIGIGSFSQASVPTLFAGSNYTGVVGAANTNVHTLRFQATGEKALTYTFDGVTNVIAVPSINMYEPAIELTSYLFARHGTNGVQVYDNEGTRIYYHREYLADGTLVLNMIPCKNASNVVGMYDLVSGQFFTNQGTGDLVAGDPVSDPVEVYADGLQETITIKDDQSATVSAATCEDLLSVGTYTDEQEILSGAITRNVGVLVLDGVTAGAKIGTAWNTTYKRGSFAVSDMKSTASGVSDAISTHFAYTPSVYGAPTVAGFCTNSGSVFICFLGLDNVTSADTANAWLAAQYAAGTPVIVVYPLATPTTESVAGQTLQVTNGDNIVEITQASLTGLELEVTYMKNS